MLRTSPEMEKHLLRSCASSLPLPSFSLHLQPLWQLPLFAIKQELMQLGIAKKQVTQYILREIAVERNGKERVELLCFYMYISCKVNLM